MITDPEKVQDLVHELIEDTKNDKIQWNKMNKPYSGEFDVLSAAFHELSNAGTVLWLGNAYDCQRREGIIYLQKRGLYKRTGELDRGADVIEPIKIINFLVLKPDENAPAEDISACYSSQVDDLDLLYTLVENSDFAERGTRNSNSIGFNDIIFTID